MAISTAVDLGRVSNVVGYELKKGNFRPTSPNLPHRIAILAEANAANQTGLDSNPVELSNAQEAGEQFGYGSPIHSIMRILRPNSGSGVGSVPTIVYPQPAAVGAVAAVRELTVSGAPTENVTHFIEINGRTSIDGERYAINITTDDTPTTIATKIRDAANAVLGCPASATAAAAVATFTAKWAGLTSEQLDVVINTNGNAAGLSYATVATVNGSGTPDIDDALNAFGDEWNTLVINSYDTAQLDTLDAFNGVPDPASGRYTPIVFKPFTALWGSVSDDKDVLTAITDTAARKSQVTNVLCPAPNSKGFTYEASANGAYLAATVFDATPNLDISDIAWPDMPMPADLNIGDFADYENRDFMVKKGTSTVDVTNGRYVFKDFVTTYHPDGETPPQFRYPRNLNVDWNVRYGYFLLEQLYVVNHSIARDDEFVTAEKVVKPKQWKGVISDYADDLGQRNLITDVDFMKASIVVGLGETNPDRFESAFSYKRSGTVRISSTTATAGFDFGTGQ